MSFAGLFDLQQRVELVRTVTDPAVQAFAAREVTVPYCVHEQVQRRVCPVAQVAALRRDRFAQ